MSELTYTRASFLGGPQQAYSSATLARHADSALEVAGSLHSQTSGIMHASAWPALQSFSAPNVFEPHVHPRIDLPAIRVDEAASTPSLFQPSLDAQFAPGMPQPSEHVAPPGSPGLRRRHAVYLAQSLFAVISREPDASILLSQLPARFKRATGQAADIRQLGYRKLSDLLHEFPELFRIVGDPKGGHQMVFAATRPHGSRIVPGV